MPTTDIVLKVIIDDNKIPQQINWHTNDAIEQGECKSMMLALWDAKENNTLRIDLWTKDMSIDEMKKFYIQNIITLTDTYIRATNDVDTAKQIKDTIQAVGKKLGVMPVV